MVPTTWLLLYLHIIWIVQSGLVCGLTFLGAFHWILDQVFIDIWAGCSNDSVLKNFTCSMGGGGGCLGWFCDHPWLILEPPVTICSKRSQIWYSIKNNLICRSDYMFNSMELFIYSLLVRSNIQAFNVPKRILRYIEQKLQEWHGMY